MLGDLLVASTLGTRSAPEFLDLALYRGGTEIRAQGYDRLSVRKGQWSVRGATATVTATFGPFATRTSFDTFVLLDGKTEVERIAVGQIDVPPGVSYQHEAVFTIGEA